MVAHLMTTARAELADVEPTSCPVCHKDHDGTHPEELDYFEMPGTRTTQEDAIHHAAHCCLWKQYDHAARTRIVQRVEQGSNWAEAIDGEVNV